MGWKDDLREASFKGIPFFVDKVEDEFGRRIVHNEFPGKEIGSIQDLGRKDDVYNITGFLFGDYAKNLESLEDALNESGSGALVHPYRASSNVVPDGYSVIRIKDDGGYAQINMRFIKAEFEGGIVITASFTNRLSAAAQKAADLSGKEFAAKFDLAGLPASLAELSNTKLETLTKTLLDPVSDVAAGVKEFQEGTAELYNAIAEWNAVITAFSDNPLKALAGGAGFQQNLLDLFQFPGLSEKSKLIAQRRFFYEFGSSQPQKNVAAKLKRQVDQNEKALSAVIRQTAVIAAVQTVLNVDFDTYDEAVVLRDELADVLDTEIVSTENIELSQTLQELQKTLVEAITEQSADLKTVSSYETKSVLPACVIAYELYGDYSKADEIVSRNKIKNPLFVPANKTLEVLV